MTIIRYCLCGAVLHTDQPRAKRQRVLMNWYDKHQGEGHGDTTEAGARAARMGEGQEAKRAVRHG